MPQRNKLTAMNKRRVNIISNKKTRFGKVLPNEVLNIISHKLMNIQPEIYNHSQIYVYGYSDFFEKIDKISEYVMKQLYFWYKKPAFNKLLPVSNLQKQIIIHLIYLIIDI